MPDPIRGVNPATGIDVAPTGQSGNARANAPSGQSQVPASAADSADVARAEAVLATISTAADGVPTVDEARVAELRDAVQSGTYRADPQQIARKLLQIEGLLTPPGSGK